MFNSPPALDTLEISVTLPIIINDTLNRRICRSSTPFPASDTDLAVHRQSAAAVFSKCPMYLKRHLECMLIVLIAIILISKSPTNNLVGELKASAGTSIKLKVYKVSVNSVSGRSIPISVVILNCHACAYTDKGNYCFCKAS